MLLFLKRLFLSALITAGLFFLLFPMPPGTAFSHALSIMN